jgi:4-hydroxy-tetrahydrodipicolinate reductase
MGRRVLELACRDDRFEVAAALTKPGCSTSGTTLRAGDRIVVITETLDAPCDVLIDFTVADATMAWLEVCAHRRIPMVIGATGHDDRQLARIREAARIIPILKATNFSLGIQAILNIVGRLAKELGESYDIEVVEAHHRHKVDAPSGTALTLIDEIAAATGRTREENVVFGRHGHTGERPAGQIGVHAIRMGEFIGWHEVHFSGPGETITIRHTPHSRDTFAAGALRAAAWIAGRKPGLYSMTDTMSAGLSRPCLDR